MKNVIVKTQALKKYYQTGNQTVRALDGVNFEVAEREFVSIVGKSGSDCPGQYQIYLSRPVQARIIKCRKGGYKPKIAYFCTFKFF